MLRDAVCPLCGAAGAGSACIAVLLQFPAALLFIVVGNAVNEEFDESLFELLHPVFETLLHPEQTRLHLHWNMACIEHGLKYIDRYLMFCEVSWTIAEIRETLEFHQ